MATVITLADVQREKAEAGDELGAAVVELIVNEFDPMGWIPFEDLGTTEISHKRSNSIPTIGFRQGRGATYGGVDAPLFDKVVDEVFPLGAQIDIDIMDNRDQKAPGLMEDRVEEAIKGISWTFKDYLINGDHATDPYGFQGLAVRLSNMGSGQIVYGNTSSAELDLTGTPSEADMYQFMDRIDAAVEALDGGMADIALTQGDFIATLRSVLRKLGKFTERPIDAENVRGFNQRRTSADLVNTPVMIYPEDKGIPWYNMGFKADQSTLIVANETVNSQDCRPVYFAKIGHPYVYGIQEYAMDIRGPMELDDGVTSRVTVDWPMGLHHVHNKAISKLAGCKVA